uniref:DELLA RGL1-like protein n=1 Tax=Boehmeria nivea TaxID=83906 RepID=A0A5J6WGJ2_BOENI|nr:DELLA RGL1-like protein [Boehmeria nivea]
MEELNSLNGLCSDFSFLSEDNFSIEEGFLYSKYQPQQQHDHGEISEFGLLNDDARFNVASPPLETCLEEIENAKLGGKNVPILIQGVVDQAKKEIRQCPNEFASLELLNSYGSGLRRLKRERVSAPKCREVQGKRLSMDEVLRIAGARFIHSSSQAQTVGNVTCATSHPFECSFSGFSLEERKDIELVELLLTCAEKVGYQLYERASKLLGQCDKLCSSTGNPVERAVYYFCEALREKVNRETGRISAQPQAGKQKVFDPDEAMMSLNATKHAIHEAVPFSQLSLFAGIQAIVERVEEAKKVHIIDIGTRTGLQWTVLMQALEASSRRESPLELLKITVIGTRQEHLIEETGKRLLSFAQTLEIPLSFKLVMVSDMSNLKEELFELDPDETVAIYASHVLRSMLSRPDQLESLMRVVITGLNPSVMVVTEVEASLNSPAFVSRFTEALFFFGAYFDCLDTFMRRDDENRMVCESLYFGEAGIRDVVANEGTERKARNVTVDVWRAFFARFGLEDAELSPSSLYQATLILKKFSCEDSCSIDMNGKCAIFRWKGTPIQSLSVWKFREN